MWLAIVTPTDNSVSTSQIASSIEIRSTWQEKMVGEWSLVG